MWIYCTEQSLSCPAKVEVWNSHKHLECTFKVISWINRWLWRGNNSCVFWKRESRSIRWHKDLLINEKKKKKKKTFHLRVHSPWLSVAYTIPEFSCSLYNIFVRIPIFLPRLREPHDGTKGVKQSRHIHSARVNDGGGPARWKPSRNKSHQTEHPIQFKLQRAGWHRSNTPQGRPGRYITTSFFSPLFLSATPVSTRQQHSDNVLFLMISFFFFYWWKKSLGWTDLCKKINHARRHE